MAGLDLDTVLEEHIPIYQLGAGVAHGVALIVELLRARNKLFLIEELETELHPAALRMLMKLIPTA